MVERLVVGDWLASSSSNTRSTLRTQGGIDRAGYLAEADRQGLRLRAPDMSPTRRKLLADLVISWR